MKLIIVGANGFVAKELIRQSLRLPAIGEIVAVSRSDVPPPSKLYPNSNLSKLQVVKVEDYDVYTDETKKAFSGADACIWCAFLVSCTNTTLESQPCVDTTGDNQPLLILAT